MVCRRVSIVCSSIGMANKESTRTNSSNGGPFFICTQSWNIARQRPSKKCPNSLSYIGCAAFCCCMTKETNYLVSDARHHHFEWHKQRSHQYRLHSFSMHNSSQQQNSHPLWFCMTDTFFGARIRWLYDVGFFSSSFALILFIPFWTNPNKSRFWPLLSDSNKKSFRFDSSMQWKSEQMLFACLPSSVAAKQWTATPYQNAWKTDSLHLHFMHSSMILFQRLHGSFVESAHSYFQRLWLHSEWQQISHRFVTCLRYAEKIINSTNFHRIGQLQEKCEYISIKTVMEIRSR